MKIKLSVILIFFIFLLTGCGNDNKTTEEKSSLEETESEEVFEEELVRETDFSSSAPGQWQKSDNGEYRLTGYGFNEELGLDFSENPFIPFEIGPMGITVEDLSVIDYKPNDAQKRVVFGEKEKVRIINAYLVIENFSDSDIQFDPDEAVLILSNGEKLNPLKFWTWTIDGNFTAHAIKAVSIAWATEDTESELTSVRIAIEPPILKETTEALSDPAEIEIEILPY